MPCTRHRVFLATLVVACKYVHDSSPKNKHWAKYAQLFDLAELNLMERQLLFLLDFDLRFDEEEACRYFAPFMPKVESPKETRAAAVAKVSKARKTRDNGLATPTSEARQSAVHSLAKQLSKTFLSVPAPVPIVPSPSSSSGCTTDSETAYESSTTDSEADDGYETPSKNGKKYTLRSLPAHPRQGSVRHRICSTDTVKIDDARIPVKLPPSPSPSPARKIVFHSLPHREKRLSSCVYPVSPSLDGRAALASSGTLPRVARARQPTESFLGRMWEAATRGTQSASSEATDSDVNGSNSVAGGALRRLTHRRSSAFRQTQALEV
jgi:PHO85 cyclin-1